MIKKSKMNFTYILSSGNKVDRDYKDNAKVSKIWFSSWIMQESLNFYLKRNYIPYFWVPLNHSWLFSLTLTEIHFGYIGKVILDIPLFLDFLLFYTALLLIFLDFLNELLQNYLFLEDFQMLTYCHCKLSYKLSDVLSQ